MILTLPEVMTHILSQSSPKVSKSSSCTLADLSACGLLILDEFDNAVHIELLETLDAVCGELGIDKPHILGLSSNILKTNCSADELKRDIYALEEASGCKVETSNEFAVTGCFDEKVIVCDQYRYERRILTFINPSHSSNLSRDLMDTIEATLVFLQTCLCKSFDRLPEDFEDRAESKEPLSTQKNPISLPLFYLEQVRPK